MDIDLGMAPSHVMTMYLGTNDAPQSKYIILDESNRIQTTVNWESYTYLSVRVVIFKSQERRQAAARYLKTNPSNWSEYSRQT